MNEARNKNTEMSRLPDYPRNGAIVLTRFKKE